MIVQKAFKETNSKLGEPFLDNSSVAQVICTDEGSPNFRSKSYKVRLNPNQKQQTQINKTIGCARFVYNRFLALRKELYETQNKTLNYNRCSQQLTLLKKELTWLSEVDKFALQNSLKNLETSYKNFFEGLKKAVKKIGFPRFKKKHGFKQTYKTNFTNNNIEVREIT